MSVGWGLVVWVFGEAFGGIFAPGVTWLFGFPGAVLFYVAAGALIALPERRWESPRLGRGILAVTGVFFVGMAVLQAWPGRGFWQGNIHGGDPGTLTGMVQQMSRRHSPASLLVGSCLRVLRRRARLGGQPLRRGRPGRRSASPSCRARPSIVRWAVLAGVVLCLADWVLVEDFGFLGGVGTDPNSHAPDGARLRRRATSPSSACRCGQRPSARSRGSHGGRRPGGSGSSPTYAFRGPAAAIGAIGVVLSVPPRWLRPRSTRTPTRSRRGGRRDPGRRQLAGTSLRPRRPATADRCHSATCEGRTVALTFLDPVCTSDCPIIAQEFHRADTMLGSDARHVTFVAVVANPLYRSTVYTDRLRPTRGALGTCPTGSTSPGRTARSQRVWNAYGIQVGVSPAGSMIAHGEETFIIDGRGRTRVIMDAQQGEGAASESSFTVLVNNEIERVLHS